MTKPVPRGRQVAVAGALTTGLILGVVTVVLLERQGLLREVYSAVGLRQEATTIQTLQESFLHKERAWERERSQLQARANLLEAAQEQHEQSLGELREKAKEEESLKDVLSEVARERDRLALELGGSREKQRSLTQMLLGSVPVHTSGISKSTRMANVLEVDPASSIVVIDTGRRQGITVGQSVTVLGTAEGESGFRVVVDEVKEDIALATVVGSGFPAWLEPGTSLRFEER